MLMSEMMWKNQQFAVKLQRSYCYDKFKAERNVFSVAGAKNLETLNKCSCGQFSVQHILNVK